MARHSGAVREVVDDLALPSQALLEAVLNGDVDGVEERLRNRWMVDVNYVGTVNLRVRCAETVLCEERADQVRIQYEEFLTCVTPLFAAAHLGHYKIVRKLVSAGADVNHKLFRGYASTAASRGGHCDILGMLLRAGSSQPACEEALLEASIFGEAEAVQLVICSDMPRPDSLAHALVTACCRGFLDVVKVLTQNGVDVNCMRRVLLRSAKPFLHAYSDCTPLVAAVICRQIHTVKYLLQVGAHIDCKVCVGAWSWDPVSGEELRVGACLGEVYNAVWCAVEYYEASGEILKMLLQHKPHMLENHLLGRTLLCHAILCQNTNSVTVLLNAGANLKFAMRTKYGDESRPLHLAARVGCLSILKILISHGSDVNARTKTGETALMIAAEADRADCFLELLVAGADVAVVNDSGDTAMKLARRSKFASRIIDILSQTVASGARVYSTDIRVFSSLHFVATTGNLELLQMVIHQSISDINELDGAGLTPAMVAVKAEQMGSFRLLVMAGADMTVETTPDGGNVVSIIRSEVSSNNRDLFEKILLNAVLANVLTDHSAFTALHYAARIGDTPSLVQLLKMGFHVNLLDRDGYSPLMHAAKNGHHTACKLLLGIGGAHSGLTNEKGESALSLVRRSNKINKATENVLLGHMARSHVLAGEEILKHTREGRGSPHMKTVRMLRSGVLTWGRSKRRNVACKEAATGESLNFLKNQRKHIACDKNVIFRVVTMTGREVHFESRSSLHLELWVRGINLIVKEKATEI